MPRKNERKTPRSKIKQAIRILSLRSREKNCAMKAAKRTCNRCGKKASVAKGREVKVEAHHKHGIDWEEVITFISERVLQTPEDYEILCKGCHLKEHGRYDDANEDENNGMG